MCSFTNSQDVYFEVLTGSKSELVQKLWHKVQIFPYPHLANSKWWMAILRPFIPFFRQLCLHLSKNWGSDGHFEVLNLVQKLWHKMQMGRLLIGDDSLVSSPESLCLNQFLTGVTMFSRSQIHFFRKGNLCTTPLIPHMNMPGMHGSFALTTQNSCCSCLEKRKKRKTGWKIPIHTVIA